MKKFTRRFAVTLSLITICVAVTVAFGYKPYVKYRFSREVIDYSRQSERRAAHAAFNISCNQLSKHASMKYGKRLAVLDDEADHNIRTAIHDLTDPDYPKNTTGRDSFSKVLDDLTYSFSRKERTGKDLWELNRAQSRIGIIAWPFILERLRYPMSDGTRCTVSYDEYLHWKQEFERDKKKMEAVLEKAYKSI